jgi:hypothetical protein
MESALIHRPCPTLAIVDKSFALKIKFSIVTLSGMKVMPCHTQACVCMHVENMAKQE